MTYTSDRPISVDGVRLDTLAWNITKIQQQTAGRRSIDQDHPLLDGVMPSLSDSLDPARFGLEMFVRGTDADGLVPPAGVAQQFRQNLDELVHLFGKRHAFLEVTEQVGPGEDLTNLATNPAMVTAASQTVTNRVKNPSAEVTAAGTRVSGGGVVNRTTSVAVVGAAAFQVTGSPVANPEFYFSASSSAGDALPVVAGAQHTFSVWCAASKAGIPQTFYIYYYDNGGALVGQANAAQATVGTGWERRRVTFPAAPGTAVRAEVSSYHPGSVASGDSIYFDGAMLTEGTTLHDYFDGSGAPGNTGLFLYAWTGTAHASTSTRTGPLVEYARNLFTNPDAEWDDGWYPNDGNYIRVWATDQVRTGTRSMRYNRSGAAPASPQITSVYGSGVAGATLPARASTTYGKGGFFRSSVPTTIQLTMGWIDSAGAVTAQYANAVAIPANVWTWVAATFTSLASTVAVYPGYVAAVISANAAATDYVWSDGMYLAERTTAPTADDYFSGNTATDGTFTHSWAWTVNRSESVRWVTPLAPYANQGVRSFRSSNQIAIEPTSLSTDSYVAASIPVATLAGKTATVRADVTVPVALSGGVFTERVAGYLAVLFAPSLPGGFTVYALATGAGSGTREARLSFPVPADATNLDVRLYNGSTSVALNRVIFDNLTIVGSPQPYHGPSFHGDTTDTSLVTYSWTGTPDASTSTVVTAKRRALAKLADVIAPDLNAVGSAATFNVGLTIPSGMWEDAATQVWTSEVVGITGTLVGQEVTTLQGSTERINDAIFLAIGPATLPQIIDAQDPTRSVTGPTLAAGQVWRFNSATWESVRGTGISFDTTAGLTDVSSSTIVNGAPSAYGLPLTPARDTGARRVKVTYASGGGNGGTTALSIRARRKWAL